MTLETMTLEELKLACKDAGVKDYGTKAQIIERIKNASIAALTNTPEKEITVAQEQMVASAIEKAFTPEAPAPQPVPVVFVNSPTNIKTLPPVNHKAHVQEVLDWSSSNLPGVMVKYDEHQEVFTFDGGRQGRQTTTARQPLGTFKAAAIAYRNVAQYGQAQRDLGSVG